ncbi:MAG: STAS domain-containing protein [Candidatus Omnitrophica bacterium]|nr:STAS domain-containing protein [Candidatus Omnitrophota bacterium]
MQIKVEDKNTVTICYVTGDIDINTAPDIKKTFDRVIQGKKPKVLVNFQSVNYVDSSGLATLVEFLKNIRAYGGKLKLCTMSPKIKSLFEITKLDRLFEIAPAEGDAVTSFA